MKNKIEIGLFGFLSLLFTALLTGFFISLACLLVLSIKASGKDYVGAIVGSLGNAIGGFISAIVAYIVANLQIKKSLESTRNKDINSNYAILRLVKVELERCVRLIRSSKDNYLSEKRDFINYISWESWDRCSVLFGREVSDQTIGQISSTYSKIKLLASGKSFPSQLYDDLIVNIDDTIHCVDTEISKL